MLGDGNQWASFRGAWNVRLNGLMFHAADCESGYGHFRGMPKTERHRLHRDLTRMVAESGLIGYGHVIDLAGCPAVVPEVLKTFPDMPYYDCFLKTVIKLSDFAAHFIPRDYEQWREKNKLVDNLSNRFRYASLLSGAGESSQRTGAEGRGAGSPSS